MKARVPGLSKKNRDLVWDWAEQHRASEDPLACAYFLACASLGELVGFASLERRIGKSISPKAKRDEFDIADDLREAGRAYRDTLAREILAMLKRES